MAKKLWSVRRFLSGPYPDISVRCPTIILTWIRLPKGKALQKCLPYTLRRCITSALKHCSRCNGHYSNEKSHQALCTRQTVTCVYPALHPEDPAETVVLHRQEGVFHCFRCSKRLKKDQNMKVPQICNSDATIQLILAGTCTSMSQQSKPMLGE
jgi:hypothetical protein